jgi:acetyl-CoA acetyltransferase
MNSAVIVDAVRSPLAKGRAADGDRLGGALSRLHPVELLSQVFSQLFERNGIDPATVDDVITGCVSQVGEQSGLSVAGRGWRRVCLNTCRAQQSTGPAARVSRLPTSRPKA